MPLTSSDRGVRLRVRLTPRGGADRVDGIVSHADGASVVKARVAAPPTGGAANLALVRLVAKWLDVSKSSVRIITGEQSRIKTLEIEGDPHELTRRFTQKIADSPRN